MFTGALHTPPGKNTEPNRKLTVSYKESVVRYCWDHPFGTYAKFSQKNNISYPLIPPNVHVRVSGEKICFDIFFGKLF